MYLARCVSVVVLVTGIALTACASADPVYLAPANEGRIVSFLINGAAGISILAPTHGS